MGLFRIGKVFESLLVIAVVLFRVKYLLFTVCFFFKFFVLDFVMLFLALEKKEKGRNEKGYEN